MSHSNFKLKYIINCRHCPYNLIKYDSELISVIHIDLHVFSRPCLLGYEPADLTVHPPPPQNCRGWVQFFRIGV